MDKKINDSGPLVGFIGTILTLVVGISTYYASENSNRELLKANADMAALERREKEAEEYLKEQLKFYSFIHGMLEANEAVYNKLSPENDPIEYSHLQIYDQVVVDSILIPNNKKIVSEILKNPHLIEGDTIPPSYSDFISHATIWSAFQHASKADSFSYNPRSPVGLLFPKAFDDEITKAAIDIKRRYYEYISMKLL